jgi:hypothetical protein
VIKLLVDHHDVARLQRWNEYLLHVEQEKLTIAGPSMIHGASMQSLRNPARKVSARLFPTRHILAVWVFSRMMEVLRRVYRGEAG